MFRSSAGSSLLLSFGGLRWKGWWLDGKGYLSNRVALILPRYIGYHSWTTFERFNAGPAG